MELPKFGMPQNPDPYTIPQPGSDKKKLFFMFGGVAILLLLLGFILFGSGSIAGQPQMQTSIENSSDAIGILDEYLDDISSTGLKNDLSLALILLRGNQQSLSDLYKETFPKGKNFSRTPKPDEPSVEKLDQAKRNNVLDSEIITVLDEKVRLAQRSLTQAKAHFKGKNSRATITATQGDLKQVEEILGSAR